MAMNIKEYRAQLAQAFIHVLQENELDWKQKWQRVVPQSAITHKNYRGINRFMLSLVAMERGYEDPRWATYKQIQDKGWKLHEAKGQGVKVEYWYPWDNRNKKAITWEEYNTLLKGLKKDRSNLDAEMEIERRFSLRSRYATVFNASLIEGIPEWEKQNRQDISIDKLVNILSNSMQVPIHNDGGDRAYYSLTEDAIHLPRPETFFTSYDYNSVAFHELAHATGAEHRLNREYGAFGSEQYAKEELVAEITSCFMAQYTQIEQDEAFIENHKAYVKSWIQAIDEQPEALVKAIQQAEKATAYMERHAGLVQETEYTKVQESSMEVPHTMIVEEKSTDVPVKEFSAENKLVIDQNTDLKKLLENTGVRPEIYPAKFTVNYNAVASQKAVWKLDEGYEISVGFSNGWEPVQVQPSGKTIEQTISAVVCQDNKPIKMQVLGKKESMTLEGAEKNYEDMLKEWKLLSGQPTIDIREQETEINGSHTPLEQCMKHTASKAPHMKENMELAH